MDKLTRRNIRYICFRLQIEAGGGNKAQADKLHLRFVDEVKEHMESQDDFDGWKNFGKTWDVGDKAPLVVILRTSSIQTEWNKVVEKEAKELPTKKFLTNKLSEEVQEAKKKQLATLEEIPPQEEVQENRKQSKKSFWDKLK